MHDQMYFVYMVASTSGTLYTGVTNDLKRRVWQHKNKQIEGFSKKYNCNKLVYYEQHGDIREAIQREKFLKGKNRVFKENLIRTVNPGWKDLAKSMDGAIKRDSSLRSE